MSQETRSAILAAKYVSTMPGIPGGVGSLAVTMFAPLLTRLTLVAFDVVALSLVSNLIFFTVLLFTDPFDDLIEFDAFVRASNDSSVERSALI